MQHPRCAEESMDKRAELIQRLQSLTPPATADVWWATVVSVEGNACTVDILNTDLADVGEVRLVADGDASDTFVVTPAIGSLVLVGIIEGELADLFVVQYSQIEAMAITIDKASVWVRKEMISLDLDTCSVVVTKEAAHLSQDGTEITLKGGLVSIKNNSVNLKDLFSDLTSLLTSFKVITPVQGVPTPSVSLDPGTTAKITQLSTKISQLLS